MSSSSTEWPNNDVTGASSFWAPSISSIYHVARILSLSLLAWNILYKKNDRGSRKEKKRRVEEGSNNKEREQG